MTTHVIILAQGRQERLGASVGPKQLLPLPACADTPIIARTLGQIWLGGHGMQLDDAVTVVTWHEVIQKLNKQPPPPFVKAALCFTSLADPGNSSLKGIHRYLEQQALIAGAPRYDRTVVLLGDVIYSWRCLATLVPMTGAIGFVGTSDISPSGGELWGVAWERTQDGVMMESLERALTKHPPYETYQPGQLRRWMWALHPSYHTTNLYTAIDDYTKDIDTPADLDQLHAVSQVAAEDDAQRGIRWERGRG